MNLVNVSTRTSRRWKAYIKEMEFCCAGELFLDYRERDVPRCRPSVQIQWKKVLCSVICGGIYQSNNFVICDYLNL